MKPSEKSIRAAAIAILFGATACGKKIQSKTPPLSAPGSVSPSGIQDIAPEKVGAEAEVLASSGPVELSLLLYKKTIQKNESLWDQIRIRNIGDKDIVIADPIFQDPGAMRKNIHARYGVYIEVVGPDGKPLSVAPHPDMDRGVEPKESGLLRIEGPKEQQMVDSWRKQGLADRVIAERIVEFNIKKSAEKNTSERPKVLLRPGEKVETKSWFYYGDWARILKKRPEPRPIGDFAQLEFFDLDEPGEYRLRAVFDNRLSEELEKKLGLLQRHPEDIVVRTPWIRVSVRP